MKSFKSLALPALLMLLTCSGAGAQTVYRCGNSYSQTPCSNAVTVPIDDARSDAQRADAKQGLARDKTLAKEMESDRRKEEAQALARDREAIARAEVAHKKEGVKEGKKGGDTGVASAKPRKPTLRSVKVQQAGVFTATDGKGAVKVKKKKTTATSTQP
jgi:hypothetical protein